MNAVNRCVRKGWLVATLGIGLLTAGCASYYMVVDPQSGRQYYTQGVDTLRDGAVKLKDARTGSMVTLQNSQVKKISSDEYKAALATAPAPAPAAAPTEAPVPAPADQPQ